jgi:hypothetical protein
MTRLDRWLDRWSTRVMVAGVVALLFFMLSLCLLWH